jgi:hypothetical protein
MDTNKLADELQECVRLLQADRLPAERLRACADAARALAGNGQRQDILYLWTLFSSVTSTVNGLALIEDGTVKACPEDPEDWSYKSVLEAMNDGWRIISFPNMALMMDDSKTYGLGNEFILEKLRDAPAAE